MQPEALAVVPTRTPNAARSWLERLFGRWWRRQTEARQDRYATLAPLLSVLLFLAAIISAFWYLRNEEVEREQDTVKRDTEISQQQLRVRLVENQEQLAQFARDLTGHSLDRNAFASQAATFMRERPEIVNLVWVGAARERVAGYSTMAVAMASTIDSTLAGDDTPSSMPSMNASTEPEAAFLRTRDKRQPNYSRAFIDSFGNSVFQVQMPLLERRTFTGALIAEYSIERLVRYYVPTEVAGRHIITLLDPKAGAVASTPSSAEPAPSRRSAIVYEVPLAPAANGLVLRGQGYRTSIGLIGNTLFWMVALLSVLTVWMLLGTWRHMRTRMNMQSALESETNFRRAMENSMLTGMRAMDQAGRITYVNPAFCAMTGFSEADLIGRSPPYPHWPADRREENSRFLEQELQGKSPSGGIEVRVMRKDGSQFDSRMYVSPLIDPKGQQTGWMTSMTNITEAKRVRDQLSASHERFTTVLEGLDTAVSVVLVQQGELLFANHAYRLWFGAETKGHALLSGGDQAARATDIDDAVDDLGGLPTQELTEAGSDSREVFIEPLQKWFDVRARYLQWTDGRLAQMLIATDVTSRRNAEEAAANQAQKSQVTSRLVTMGEMASSVAHELNQPLTAITNYCNGMVTRVQNNAIDKADLIAALQKTSRQAERAGQIIHRIRAFVKRSEPQRQRAYAHTIIEDAVDLAGIELRRRNVAIHTYVAQRLPALMVDPILIEQVLLNLLKNAAEAIDNAHLSQDRRRIELRVVPRHTEDEGEVIEFNVTDRGPGIKEDVLARMYEAFFSTKVDGLGIGLSLCRSIIESHQGRLKATNLYNGELVTGSCFTFTLPVEITRLATPTVANA